MVLKNVDYIRGDNLMPKELERSLEKQAKKKGFKGERRDRYIYGTMRKMGWKPKREMR